VVVVVSAMGQTTDELIRLAHRVSRTPSRRELDMLLTTGERVSMTLLSMALQSLGCPAISFTGSQGGIVTDSRQGDARIRSVRAFRIREELERGRVVIVAGFQGVSPEKEVTTLGRGGSDTTAVALAIHLGAKRCEIYTDVPGVLSADPRIVPGARLLPEIDYEPMITLSHLGGRVLFRRAVILARKYRLQMEVLGSREDRPGTRIPRDTGAGGDAAAPRISKPGTISATGPRRASAGSNAGPNPHESPATTGFRKAGIVPEEDLMESDRVLGVALESPVRWVRVAIPAGTPDRQSASPADGGTPASLSASSSPPTLPRTPPSLPAGGTPIFLFFARTLLPEGDTLVQFAVTEDADLDGWLDPTRWGVGARVEVEPRAAVISLVGEGVLACGEMLRRAESLLATEGIPTWGLHTGTLSLSILLAEAHAEAAARLLHRELVEKA
jgi:aspartokinase